MLLWSSVVPLYKSLYPLRNWWYSLEYAGPDWNHPRKWQNQNIRKIEYWTLSHLQFHHVLVGTAELIHYLILFFLAWQRENILECGRIAGQERVYLLPHLLPLFLLVVEITEKMAHWPSFYKIPIILLFNNYIWMIIQL